MFQQRFPKTARAARRRIFLAGALAIAVTTLAIWLGPPAPKPVTPGIESSGGVAELSDRSDFVGTARCAECHTDKASDYATSGHSRTFHIVDDSPIASQLDGQSYVDPIRGTTFRYSMDNDGLAVSIPEVFGDDPFPLQYALGSGQHAFTFLTLIPGPKGDAVGVEHRVSIYSKMESDRSEVPGGALGLTPGHKGKVVNEEVDHFGHIISGDTLADCIGCHTTTGEIRGGQVVNLAENVGCESCHGPGSEHARMMTATPSKVSASQPRQIRQLGNMFTSQWSAMDEIRLCGQCHRMPEDVRSDRITPYHRTTIRFQPIGLLKSQCFLKSDGDLSCSVCHEPHSHSSLTTPLEYVQRCLKCHSASEANYSPECPVSPRKNCIECHMPPVQIHPGVYFHDHWIRVRDAEPDILDQMKTVPANDAIRDRPIN